LGHNSKDNRIHSGKLAMDILCDTTSAAFTITLPATPSAGDIVAIADYNGTAITNNITVGRNSSDINGDATDFEISKNYSAVSFVYVDATSGWRSVDTSNIADVVKSICISNGRNSNMLRRLQNSYIHRARNIYSN
jgi:hypothetical protein